MGPSLRTADAFPVVASLPPKNRSDWPTSKQEVLRHGNRFAARVRRRYFSEGEKRRPEMRLLFAGYMGPQFYRQKRQISLSFYILQLVNYYPFIYLKPEKRYPLSRPGIGHF